MPSVSIAIQPDVLERFSDLNFKPSQAIAEFVDNAIQSYLDHKNNNTFVTANYKLVVDIKIEWAETANNKTYAKSITIIDNAAGIPKSKYDNAFETGHRPDFNEGLNEYGMGMKVAAFWLCRKWTTTSKYFAESVERTLIQNLDDIIPNKQQKLDYNEIISQDNGSYTIVRLENLYQKNNFTKAKLNGIREELASIYRAFLRRGEIQINVNEEALLFNDPKLLTAPFYSDPNCKPVEWKSQITKSMFGKEINGYIGILNEMSEKQSGLVIMRRGRVIVGESSDHLYHPESLFGSYKNGFQYKRLYGEIEIKGFSASFNKNGFSDMEELEEMLGMLKSTLKVDGHSLIKQVQEYRVKPQKTASLHTITWRYENGLPDFVEKDKPLGTPIFRPSNPSKEGFDFIGWSPLPSAKVTGDAIFTAQWKSKEKPVVNTKFTVKWIFSNGSADIIQEYKKDEKVAQPIQPSRDGYEFIGWSPSVSNIVSNNETYTAQWRKSVDEVPSQEIICSKTFAFNGLFVQMDIVKNDSNTSLLSLNMEKFQSEKRVVCSINTNKLPVKDKSINNEDVKSLLTSIAIAMFEAQMSDEDTCEGLINRIR